jgi:hypothetical protein
MFKFVFNQEIAEIRTNDDTVVISQPFRPSFSGPEPWIDEAQANQWMIEKFPQYFQEPPADSEESPE